MEVESDEHERLRMRLAWHDLAIADEDIDIVVRSHLAHSRENDVMRAATHSADEPPMAFRPTRRNARAGGI